MKLNHVTAVDGVQEWKRGREVEHQEIMNEKRDGYCINNNYHILWTNMYTIINKPYSVEKKKETYLA